MKSMSSLLINLLLNFMNAYSNFAHSSFFSLFNLSNLLSRIFLKTLRNNSLLFIFHLIFKGSGNSRDIVMFTLVLSDLLSLGRKSLPMVARLTLLDTWFKSYPHACITTIETTLNARIISITLFPNFNMSLANLHLLDIYS